MVAPVTPFRPDFGIDYDRFGALLEHIAASGAKAIVPASLTGEFFSLSLEERLDIMAFACQVNRKVDLIASTLSLSPAETLKICHCAEELGYRALIVGAPVMSAISPVEVVEYFTWLDQRVSLPIIVYNFPARIGVDVDVETVKRLADLPNVIAYKDTTGESARLRRIASEAPGVAIVCGLDELALESYAWGARSLLGGAAAFIGHQHLELWTHCVQNGDFAAGRKAMAKIAPLLAVMGKSSKYIQLCRYGSELAGLPVGEPRQPLLALTGAEKQAFRCEYNRLVEADFPG